MPWAEHYTLCVLAQLSMFFRATTDGHPPYVDNRGKKELEQLLSELYLQGFESSRAVLCARKKRRKIQNAVKSLTRFPSKIFDDLTTPLKMGLFNDFIFQLSKKAVKSH